MTIKSSDAKFSTERDLEITVKLNETPNQYVTSIRVWLSFATFNNENAVTVWDGYAIRTMKNWLMIPECLLSLYFCFFNVSDLLMKGLYV